MHNTLVVFYVEVCVFHPNNNNKVWRDDGLNTFLLNIIPYTTDGIRRMNMLLQLDVFYILCVPHTKSKWMRS